MLPQILLIAKPVLHFLLVQELILGLRQALYPHNIVGIVIFILVVLVSHLILVQLLFLFLRHKYNLYL